MTISRLALVSLLLVVCSSLTSAVTMTPSFEKTLGEWLATIKGDIAAYSGLKYTALGLPMTVDEWKPLTRSDLVAEMRVFSDSAKSDAESLLKSDPANADKINKFDKDAKDFVEFFFAGVRSKDIADPATTRPTTAPPPSKTKKASSGSGSGTPDKDVDSSTSPVPYPVYTSPPLPIITSAPILVPTIRISTGMPAYQIGMIVLISVILVIKTIHWYLKKQAKQHKQRQEQAAGASAALADEAGETNHATYVVIAGGDDEKAQSRPGK